MWRNKQYQGVVRLKNPQCLQRARTNFSPPWLQWEHVTESQQRLKKGVPGGSSGKEPAC